MSMSNPYDTTFTDNAYQAAQAQQTANEAQASANTANGSITKLNSKNTWLPVTKRLLQLRIQQYEAQYSEMMSDPLISKISTQSLPSVAKQNIDDLKSKAAAILADMTTETTVSDGVAYYIQSDENYITTYLKSLGSELAAAHKQQMQDVTNAINAASSHADDLANEAKTARQGLQTSIDGLSSKIGDLGSNSDVMSYIKQTASEISAQVVANSYQNLVDITADGVYIKAKGNNKDKKIILDGDNVVINSNMGTTIAGILTAQTIVAGTIHSDDWSTVLDTNNKYFKMGDNFLVQADGTVKINRGGFYIDDGSYAFKAGRVTDDNNNIYLTGLYQRIGSVNDTNRYETFLDAGGLHQVKGGMWDTGTWLTDGYLKVVPVNQSIQNTQKFKAYAWGSDGNDFINVNEPLTNYYNPKIMIGGNSGSNIQITSATTNGSVAGYASTLASDGLYCAYYPDNTYYPNANLAQGKVGDFPRSLTFVGNAGLKTMYRNNAKSDSGQAVLVESDVDWDGIRIKRRAGNTNRAETFTTTLAYDGLTTWGSITAASASIGAININGAHTFESADNGSFYFTKASGGVTDINAKNVRASNLYLSDGHDICSADGGKVYFSKARGSNLVAVGAASFDKNSPLSIKNVKGIIDGADALAAVCHTDWANYTYKNDPDSINQYGAIIDDVNKIKKYDVDYRFLGADGKSISQDNVIGFLAAAVKELAKRVQALNTSR